MRGLGAAAAAAAAAAGRRQTHLPSSSYAAAFSSFSGIGGGSGAGRGRGRGRGLPPSAPPRAPGRPLPDVDDDVDRFSSPPSGRGRGGAVEPVLPSSPTLPSFASFSATGRGRGISHSPPPPSPPPSGDGAAKKPIFTRRFDASSPSDPKPHPEASSSPPPLPSPAVVSGAGRGVPRPQQPSTKAPEENRHLRRRAPASSAPIGQPKISGEEALKRAMELLGRGFGGEGDGGRGRGGPGGRGRGGRGRGRFSRRDREEDERHGLFLGDKADGEKLEKTLGEEKMKILNQAFNEVTENLLPSPMEDAYLDALHTNNMIEYEPEYLVNFDNPDIDEKPSMSLQEALEKAKPFLIAYEGIQSQEEWEEAVKDVMERAPHMKELMDMYCGPDRVTAKQQEQELERVASTLPENIPSSVKRFTDKTLLSLKSNPGWGFDKKCQFMDKLVWEVSQHYK